VCALRKSDPEADRLAGFPLLSGLSKQEVSRVASAGQVVSLPANWTFISEGTPGDTAYIVLDGSVRVSAGGQHLADLGPGEVLGEAGLLKHKLRNANVSTVTPSVLLHIEQADFDKLLKDVQPLKEAIDATVAKRSAAE
jgi:CRP/FNR family cyclic AMP-dependent transcriptional regulator